MEKIIFAERLRQAAERTRDFTRTLIIEPLPDAIRFDVQLNCSHDGDPLHPDERVYPDDPERIPKHLRSSLSQEEVVELLWREGTVPEWINLSVKEADPHTLIELECCGRFTANEQLLYHLKKGYPPFHVLGPPIPPSHDPQSKERYSLNWCMTPGDRRALSRVRERAEHVELLILSGPEFDDECLEELAGASLHRLRAVRIEGTRVRGSGLRHFVRSPLISQGLRHLSLERTAVEDEDLRVLAGLTRLSSLSLDETSISDAGLVHLRNLPKLRSLLLKGTRVGDSGLKHLSGLKLDSVDLRDTQVTELGVARLQRKCPGLHIHY